MAASTLERRPNSAPSRTSSSSVSGASVRRRGSGNLHRRAGTARKGKISRRSDPSGRRGPGASPAPRNQFIRSTSGRAKPNPLPGGKCTELGLRRLTWLITRQSRSHPPAFQRARAWMREALEQSHGCWLPQFSEQNESPYGLNSETIFCIPGSPSPTAQASPSQVSLAVGPESGWAKGEVPAASPKMGLGSNILRVETAAIAAVAWWRLQVS